MLARLFVENPECSMGRKPQVLEEGRMLSFPRSKAKWGAEASVPLSELQT